MRSNEVVPIPISVRPRRKIVPLSYTAADWERQYSEVPREEDVRSAAEIDRSRIIHCAAFRRLQGKTQIFGVAHDDFFRTRLTHSLEVAQIAKGLALIVGASPELVEAISLAHDIGHPPFGHAGERALDECMRECGFGHFESNAQNLRTLAHLEVKRTLYNGLNLTRATLDGLLKHKRRAGKGITPYYYPTEKNLISWVSNDAPKDQVSLETQIVDWADQVAYSVHDLEDGIHANMITSARLSDPFLKTAIYDQLEQEFPRELIDEPYLYLQSAVRQMEELGDARYRVAARKQLTSLLIHRFISSVHARLVKQGQARGRYTVRLIIPNEEQSWAAILKEIALRLIVQDQRVATLEHRSRLIVTRLFETLKGNDAHDLYPNEFRPLFEVAGDDKSRARVACDYIASMTDQYAETIYQRLFSPGSMRHL
jgi:dGTPase